MSGLRRLALSEVQKGKGKSGGKKGKKDMNALSASLKSKQKKKK